MNGFEPFGAGELVVIISDLGVDFYKKPDLGDFRDDIQELKKGDIMTVLQDSNTKWVKVFCRLGLGWLYRYEGLVTQQLVKL